jgi:hypothetical protein
VASGNEGEFRESFRYIRLDKAARLRQNVTYVLLMSTVAGDGDRFRAPASFDGLSPLVHPDIVALRSMLVRGKDVNDAESLPAFRDLHPSYSRSRIPVGPTLLFKD